MPSTSHIKRTANMLLCSRINMYFTRFPWQSTLRPFLGWISPARGDSRAFGAPYSSQVVDSYLFFVDYLSPWREGLAPKVLIDLSSSEALKEADQGPWPLGPRKLYLKP